MDAVGESATEISQGVYERSLATSSTLFIRASATIAAAHACKASLVKRGGKLHVTVRCWKQAKIYRGP